MAKFQGTNPDMLDVAGCIKAIHDLAPGVACDLKLEMDTAGSFWWVLRVWRSMNGVKVGLHRATRMMPADNMKHSPSIALQMLHSAYWLVESDLTPGAPLRPKGQRPKKH